MTTRAALAQFLRSRRERLRPEDVGLLATTRRRAPGLRREEVARLADVGVSWYTWLEQGREINASLPLLERIARALKLDATERMHLFALAHGTTRPVITSTDVSPILRRVVEAHPYPAFAANLRWDVLAWNRHICTLYGDYGARPPELRNHLWAMFMGRDRPHLQSRHTVARFRHDAARAADRRPFDELAERLAAASPEFAALWRDYDVEEASDSTKLLDTPVGKIQFDLVQLIHLEPDGRELRVTMFAPQPGVSTERADQLFKSETPPSSARSQSTAARRRRRPAPTA